MADKKELGLVALIAIVVSSMIGSGVDGLPQNMAAHSALGPILIAWLICGCGIFLSLELLSSSQILDLIFSQVYICMLEKVSVPL